MKPSLYALLFGLAVALAGCATDIEKPAPVVLNACPGVKHYSLEEQRAIKNAKNDLPPASPLPGVIQDWARMRAESRACAGQKNGAAPLEATP